jgi:hypothetical protein
LPQPAVFIEEIRKYFPEGFKFLGRERFALTLIIRPVHCFEQTVTDVFWSEVSPMAEFYEVKIPKSRSLVLFPVLSFKKCSMAFAMVVRVIGAIVGVGASMSRTSSQALDQPIVILKSYHGQFT